jgi:septal ring factor EnvC (AmiA/AmiB activator)
MKKENLEVILEDINSKFNLVLEGHDVLRSEIRELSRQTNERFDLVDFKIDTLNKKIDNVEPKLNQKIDQVDLKLSKKIDDVETKLSKKIDEVESKLSKKIDAVSADLSAHRADTEAHHAVYCVKECE